ncbi:hypothetical protein [Lentibacter sp. XHP0401]|jgi:hypothetical protein|uniref:hypothetical protein n=1 Tax=Lentibacter sp. XHP0401 TaxID=2984334 RepID=UPI0021E7E866|nr:hypothetical protein [Lentibacter sp. XHP0401]MCV2892187.1 hypothetical protein [Lentibacter sp. XHP0401]
MRIILTTALVSAFALSGCGGSIGGSKYNPFNWFGKSRSEQVVQGEVNPLIPKRSSFKRAEQTYQGVPVDQILELSVERAAGGAIVRVKGLSPTLGAYNVQLVPDVDPEEGASPLPTLEYTLKAEYSTRSRPNAPATSRELNAAVFVPEEQLIGVRTIRVKGAQNARSVRR